jgi:IMP dehydrogenase
MVFMRITQKALTFDDVLLLPAHSSVLPRDVSLRTQLTRNITLNIPLLSAAMDTVTESRLAIALAQEGGIGIIHKNMTAKAQALQAAKVKRFESGVVKDPITIAPDMTVRMFSIDPPAQNFGLLVVEGKRVVGIVTNRDLRFETRLDLPVHITTRDKLITVKENASRDEARVLMHAHKLSVLVVNDAFGAWSDYRQDILKSSNIQCLQRRA